jgi:ATP-binding cassette, subfamily B, bacterial MsbA
MSVATEPLLPAMLKLMLDGTFIYKDYTVIKLVPLLMSVIFFVRGVVFFVDTYVISWIHNIIETFLHEEMFNKLLNLPERF